MEKTRVKKGEKYWWISSVTSLELCEEIDFARIMDDMRFDNGNYFNTKSEAEAMARKIKAVLAGADVIEMPSEEEIKEQADALRLEWFNEGIIYSACLDMAEFFKSKTIK